MSFTAWLRTAAILCIATTGLAGCVSDLAGIDTACNQAGCALTAPVEKALLPSASADDADYNRYFLTLLARDRLNRLDRANGTGSFGRDANSINNSAFQAEYRALSKAAKAGLLNVEARGSAASAGNFDAAWRVSRQTLFINANRPASGEFQFSGLQARSVEIRIVPIGSVPARLSGRCDGDMVLATATGRTTFAAGKPFRVMLMTADAASAPPSLFPETGLQRCELTVRSSEALAPATLIITREETDDPRLAAFDDVYQRCISPDPSRLSRLERVFYADRWLSQTCPFPTGKPKLLFESRDGFNAKVEALAGRRLSKAFINRADPEAPIDFSRAPDLSLVYFSYLEFKADFSGRVMDRLIRYHAARGTKIRIMVTSVLERDKDDALLRKLAADFPNVQLQEFAWEAPVGAPIGEQLSVLHKTHHVKMLATVARDPRRSRVIVGGRNIHDGFLFHRPVNLSRYPHLQQYADTDGLSLNYYSNWDDFDMEFRQPEAVSVMTAHLATLWHRDADTDLARPFSIPGKAAARPPAGAHARHFISVPYADGRALEDYFVELFDAASQTIEIVNPYLNLTPKIAAAFGRAIDRGVRITVVGRIDMRGDIGGKFLTELNELFVDKYAGRIRMLEYKARDVVLHSKILMIDGLYVSVSSVNINNRSFFHDSENGVAVLDKRFYRRMQRVFNRYIASSRPVDPDVDIGIAYRLLFSSQQVREVF